MFAFQLPLPREGIELDYSRWMSNLLTLIVPEVAYNDMGNPSTSTSADEYMNGTLNMRVRLAVRNQGTDKDAWIEYGNKDHLKRFVSCFIQAKNRKNEYRYDCEPIPLFELQSLFHDFYLINLEFNGGITGGGDQQHNAILRDVTLVAIHANGGFTKVWLVLKSIFLVMTLSTLIWFLNRLLQLNRPMNLLEKTLTILGIALTQLNLPLEALSLIFDIPFFNSFLSDVRQGFFYVMLFCFWLVFVGEHLLLEGRGGRIRVQNQISRYYKQLSVVMVATIALLAFDSVER